jgi:4-alpha-glucanotransferase
LAASCARRTAGSKRFVPGLFDVGNTVVSESTHDNAATREWHEELPADQRNIFGIT